MEETTVKVIERLLEEDIHTKDIAAIMSNHPIREALENGADFSVSDSIEEFGEENSDSDLYEGEGYVSWGEFLLSVPGAWENMKLPTRKVFSVIK